MTDLALKSYTTTGSISTSSSILTVASNPGFVIGDPIIVEIGGEAGTGLRGTVGVGGTWPTKSYANAAAMNADTSQVDGLYAWLVDTGMVYRFATGTGVWTIMDSGLPYFTKAVPKALVTTISNIAGLVFTLAGTSVAAATNANVYYDNEPYLTESLYTTPLLDGSEINIAAGAFAISRNLIFGFHIHDGRTLQGQGVGVSEIFSPNGCICPWIQVEQSSVKFKDFSLRGNCGDERFGLAWLPRPTGGTYASETEIDQGLAFGFGITINLSTGSLDEWTAENIDIYDCFRPFVVSASQDITAKNCRSIRSAGLLMYIQWDFQWANCTNGLIEDCTVDSPHLVPGFEAFASTDVEFIRPIGRNAIVSSNSAIRMLIGEAQLTIEADSIRPEFVTFDWLVQPIINFNSNITPGVGEGGYLRNPTIIQEGYADGASGILQAIVVNNTGVRVTGGYPCRPNVGGLIQMPNSAVTGSHLHENLGTDTEYSGLRCIGASTIQVLGAVGMIISDCVYDTDSGVGTYTNNYTNAYYEANYDTLCPALVGVEILDLPAAATLDGTELVPIVQDGETRYATVAAISNMIWDSL